MTQEQFINEHMAELIDMKMKLGPGRFVYLHPENGLMVGNSSDYGHNAVMAFGGPCKTRQEAARELEHIAANSEARIEIL